MDNQNAQPDPLMVAFNRPSWADPFWMQSANEWESEFTSPAPNTIVKVANASGKRWGIIFLVRTGGVAKVTPLSGLAAAEFDGWIVSEAAPQRFTIFDFGPLPQSEWYFLCNGAADLRVIEINVS